MSKGTNAIVELGTIGAGRKILIILSRIKLMAIALFSSENIVLVAIAIVTV
ncbi:hypothetical protein [Nostoc sp.]